MTLTVFSSRQGEQASAEMQRFGTFAEIARVGLPRSRPLNGRGRLPKGHRKGRFRLL